MFACFHKQLKKALSEIEEYKIVLDEAQDNESVDVHYLQLIFNFSFPDEEGEQYKLNYCYFECCVYRC